MEGLRKNVRSGFNTKVWTDPWIPTIPPRPANDNGIYRDPNLYVTHLIDLVSKEWKADLIHELIDPADIPLILGLKPSKSFQVDNYVWSYNKSGLYSVKSGYRVARKLKATAEEVSEPSLTKLKAKAWNLKTSRKIKHFIWQAVSGCIASCSRLVDRHCGVDRSCPRCGAEDESLNHLLFECPPALQVWALSSVPTIPGVFPNSALFTNIDFLFWRAKELGATDEQLEPMPWIMWYIWKARNDKAFDGKEISPLDTVSLASSECLSWKGAQVSEQFLEQNEERTPRLSSQLTSPPSTESFSSVVCQTDASWNVDDICSGLGFIIYDSPAPLLGLKSCTRSLSPLHAEMEALAWAMESAIQRGYSHIRLETDCSEIQKLLDNSEDWPAFATEIENINSLRWKFIDCSINFIPRLINVRADLLAKRARARGGLFFLVSSNVPEWLPLEGNPFALV